LLYESGLSGKEHSGCSRLCKGKGSNPKVSLNLFYYNTGIARRILLGDKQPEKSGLLQIKKEKEDAFFNRTNGSGMF